MNNCCAVTGSFDPVTIGHVNIVERAKELFDKVYVLMLINPEKNYLFSVEERLEMLREVFKSDKKVEVCYFSGYTADFCKDHGIKTLVRGIRNEQDFLYEKNLAKLNYDYGKLETCFFIAEDEYKNVSSSMIREDLYRDKYWDIVPEIVRAKVREKFNG